MALGALISAYHDATGGSELRATLPLAGRTLVEYQVRLAAAVGASPVVVLVERMPASLIAAVDRLLREGLPVHLARTVAEAASAFDPDDRVLIVAGGLFADAASVETIASASGPAILTFPDNIGLEEFERIDVTSRWGGLAATSGAQLAATAAMLGDWDLQSTLLRRLVQDRTPQIGAPPGAQPPLLLIAPGPAGLEDAERRILAGSCAARADWVERHVTPLLEEMAVERLTRTGVRPQWLLTGTLGLTALGALLFALGRPGMASAALLMSVPLDSIATRLAAVRMQPYARVRGFRRMLSYSAAGALGALGAFCARSAGWGAFATALFTLICFYAMIAERGALQIRPPQWLASRKGVIVAGLPFAAMGYWTSALVATAIWAAVSFLWLQRLAHAAKTSSDVDDDGRRVGTPHLGTARAQVRVKD